MLAVMAVALAGTAAAQQQTARPLAVAQDSCSAACRTAHSQCRIATKGSPSCDAQLMACLQRCIATRGK
jgi:hypothetical protein